MTIKSKEIAFLWHDVFSQIERLLEIKPSIEPITIEPCIHKWSCSNCKEILDRERIEILKECLVDLKTKLRPSNDRRYKNDKENLL